MEDEAKVFREGLLTHRMAVFAEDEKYKSRLMNKVKGIDVEEKMFGFI